LRRPSRSPRAGDRRSAHRVTTISIAAASTIWSDAQSIAIENAYVRYVRGNENAFFTVRAGVFHPFEGFGASDRPLSNARTLF